MASSKVSKPAKPDPFWFRNYLTRKEVIGRGVPETLLRALVRSGELRTRRMPDGRLGYSREDVNRYRSSIERAIADGHRLAVGR